MATRISRRVIIPIGAIFAIITLALAPACCMAQSTVIHIWPNGAPGSQNWTQRETEYGRAGERDVRNVVDPTLTIFLPDPKSATGAAVIIAPGGAFRLLAFEKEGTKVATWLQDHGVAGLVLKYRLTDTGTDDEFAAMNAAGGRGLPPESPQTPNAAPFGGGPKAIAAIEPLSVADGHQAMRVLRERATEWKIDPQKIGIMGFSAGGYVAVNVALDDKPDTRPNFVGSIYSCCIQLPINVPSGAAPLFIASAANDPISNKSGPALFSAWTAANIPAEIHIYAQGGHGFGMSTHNMPVDTWIERFGDWLRSQKLAN
jgi:acetyl esterase/lipase